MVMKNCDPLLQFFRAQRADEVDNTEIDRKTYVLGPEFAIDSK